MKQKDIVLIIVVVFFSAVVALIVSNLFITPAKNRKADVEVVDPIVAQFDVPDSKYFNENSVNPTKLIQIQNNQNPNPFTNNGN